MLEGKQLFRKRGSKRKDTKDKICRNCRSSGRGRTIEDTETLMPQGKTAKGDTVTIASIRSRSRGKGDITRRLEGGRNETVNPVQKMPGSEKRLGGRKGRDSQGWRGESRPFMDKLAGANPKGGDESLVTRGVM